jgi:hypothetical protein
LKFIERYPAANHHEEFNTENGKIIKCYGETSCYICGEYSYFIDGKLLVCICSDECQKQVWEEFDATTKKQP